MFRMVLLLFPVILLAQGNDCRMRLDESSIDLHGWLRAFYSCQGLGRSFVMDNAIQRPLPSYANFTYSRQNYAAILKEVLSPLGLRLVQGKWIDAVVSAPPAREPSSFPLPLPLPLVGRGGAGGTEGKADSSSLDSLPVAVADTARPSRRYRAKAAGLLKSSAKRLGFSYNDIVGSAGALAETGTRNGASAAYARAGTVWQVAAIASDSLGSLDFARIVDFSAWDTAHVVFGGEIRREDNKLNYENGTSITQYTSIFDGLTVDVVGERWSFLWRRDGNILEVPGSVGSCASGSSKVSYSSSKGVPFLDKIPGLRWLFSYEHKYDDELLVSVCLEVLDEL